MLSSTNFFIKSIQAYAVLLFLLVIALTLLLLDSQNKLDDARLQEAGTGTPIFVCYYTFNSTDLPPEALDYTLCSHINAGFAYVQPSENYSISLSDENEKLLAVMASFTAKFGAKVMISVGGGGEPGDSHMSQMVSSHSRRKLFIRSLMSLIKKYKLDGVDLDWEWPVIDGGVKEKVKFIQLLREIRTEFDRHKKKYFLSAAVGAAESIVTASYYVQHMAEYVDFVNVMCYDYHFYSKLFPFTDYNAPLFPSLSDEGSFLGQFNVNYSINLWISLGMPAEKIVMGMPFYGHSFRLRSIFNHKRHAPAEGFGIGDSGFVTYTQVCQFIHSNSFVTILRDENSKVPYAYYLKDWISYDDKDSLREKVQYAKELGLRGVMVYSLNSDDHSGSCSEPFALTKAVHSYLQSW